jgi:2-polyprenyl-3-methyl-5-hydroxy-6-metoxy-1,4-benzoquinol methylase
MPDFSKRSHAIEIMDDLNCSGEIVDQTLRELDTINELLGGNYVTMSGLSKLTGAKRSLLIADLGCGSGDMLRRIRQWSERRNLNCDLIGIDANPNIVAYATRNTPRECGIEFETVDIFSDSFRHRQFDVVIGTLFFHHFTDRQLIDFFRKIKSQVRIGIVINDIHRNWFSYYSIKLLTKLFSKSAMVKFDAPLSVLRAFRKNELKSILDQAGFSNYTLKWMWAFRWQVIIYLDSSD